MMKERKLYMLLATLVFIVCLFGLYIFLERDRRVYLPVVEVYSREIVENAIYTTNAVIVLSGRNNHKFEELADRFELKFDIDNVDFSQNSLVLISNYRVKSFSFDERNRRIADSRNGTRGKEILDIVLYKQRTDEVYLYIVPGEMTSWEWFSPTRTPIFEGDENLLRGRGNIWNLIDRIFGAL